MGSTPFGHTIINMITKLLINSMFGIANMSKKASAIYLIVLTILFGGSVSSLLYGAIYLTNGRDDNPEHVTLILVLGFVLFFFVLVMIALTAIASNYVKKNPHKNPKAQNKQ